MSRYSKFSSMNDYKNMSNMIKNSNEDDLSNLLTANDKKNSTNPDTVYLNYFQQTQFVGSNSNDSILIANFFTKDVVDFISEKCTNLLEGVDEKGRQIVVPDKRIFEVMNTVYSSYNYPIGFDATISKDQYVKNMIGDSIARIVFDVKNTLQYEQCRNKYTIWTTVYGDFNKEKLRQHAPIKILKNRPNSFEFNMKY